MALALHCCRRDRHSGDRAVSYIMSDEMMKIYGEMIEKGHFAGRTTLLFADSVRAMCRCFSAKTLLDYGSGRGDQYDNHHLDLEWGVHVTCYDPAVAALRKRPEGKFDGVICIDVLEHIEEKDLPAVLSDLVGYAEKFLFLTICTRPAKKSLPDGRNCHLTIKPREWWIELLAGHVPDGLYYEVEWNA